jgi:hypothetical protein
MILEEILVWHPKHQEAKEIIEALIRDPDDRREVETATQAIENLKRDGVLRDRDDEIAEPTELAIRIGRLLMATDCSTADP